MNVCILQILYFDRIDISEGIDVNKPSVSKECDIYHCWYFLNYSFNFQPNVCNSCHDLLKMSMNLSNIGILNVEGSGFCCTISGISKIETMKLMQSNDSSKKAEHYKT